MIDLNQLINTAIANAIELAVREQLTPYIMQLQKLDDLMVQRQVLFNEMEHRLENQAKVIGFLNAELNNLKAPKATEKAQIEALISDYLQNNGDEIMDSIEDRVDRRIEHALEEFDFDTDNLDIDNKIRDYIDSNVSISIETCWTPPATSVAA